MSRRLWIVFLALALSGSWAAYAQTATPKTDDLEKQTQTLDDTATKIGNQKTFETLSKQLGVPVDVLTKQQQSTKFGFGQLFIANALANSIKASDATTKVTFESLAAEFQAGKGWGQIAKENNLKLGSVVSQIKRSNKMLERERKNETGGADASAGGGGLKGKPKASQPNGPKGNRGAGRGRG